MRIVVADAVPADAEAIAALHAASWRATYRGIMPDAFLEREADDNRRRHWLTRMYTPAPGQLVLKATCEHVFAGFACAYLDADYQWGALLDNLHVAPELTGRGVGARLLNDMLDRVSRARPASRLHLWVFESNTRAQRFYERLGGILVEERSMEVLPGLHVPELRYAWQL
jgi:ribosomal protein S18 acetylase RimI-like enzyme